MHSSYFIGACFFVLFLCATATAFGIVAAALLLLLLFSVLFFVSDVPVQRPRRLLSFLIGVADWRNET